MVNMSVESGSQDPDISHRAHHDLADAESDDSCYNEEHMISAFVPEKYNFPMKPIPNTTTTTSSTSSSSSTSTATSLARIPGRNKRKNFNPRYTATSPMNEEVSVKIKTDDYQQPHQILDATDNMSNSSKSPPVLGAYRDSVDYQPLELTPWMQMFQHYDQLVKATGLAQTQRGGDGDSGLYSLRSAANMSDWFRKVGTTTAIHDIFKVYQDAEIPAANKINENGRVAGVQDLKTLSTTNNCLSNGVDPLLIPLNSSTTGSPDVVNSASVLPLQEELTYPTNLSTNKREETPYQVDQNQCESQVAASEELEMQKVKAESLNSYYDDSSDYGERSQSKGSSLLLQFPQWPAGDELRTTERRIRSECDETNTYNTLYDEDDYPPSPNDFPDSTNDEDDDDLYSVNMFYDDEPSTTEDCQKTEESDKTATEMSDADGNRNNLVDKDGCCGTGSLKISVRNLGGFFRSRQADAVSSKRSATIDENAIHYGGGLYSESVNIPKSDFVRNMIKFTSFVECQNEICRLENLREHYHCYDFPCFGKILSKKEEVIRHMKWHRKRVESLNHGFMRFSTSDDCSTSFGSNCQHNRKQTHYHCFQPNCDRVYISTSDVQMHSNFHRKNSAIYKEGFQRFRANEECSTDYCMFAGQKTTHFHCRRENCRHTFKNKADMEKHKTYHIKDLKLVQDGFKKFLKNEACPYSQCRFSKVCNHIHCARENCFYVLHSSGQLLSHKRKHERMDNEQTYCRYKMLAVKAALLGNAAASAANSETAKSLMPDFEGSETITRPSSELSVPPSKKDIPYKDSNSSVPLPVSLPFDFFRSIKRRHEDLLKKNLNLTFVEKACIEGQREEAQSESPQSPGHSFTTINQLAPSVIQQFFTADCPSCTGDEPINLKNSFNEDEVDQVHCMWKNRSEQHLHCILKNCKAAVSNNLLEISAHIRMHGFSSEGIYGRAVPSQMPAVQNSEAGSAHSPMQITTIDGFFNRKRGRPPKNRFVEVYKNAQQSPQAIFTSFKLEKQILTKECNSVCNSIPSSSYPPPVGYLDIHQGGQIDAQLQRSTHPFPQKSSEASVSPIGMQFSVYKATDQCREPGGRCPLSMQHHYHCACTADCSFVTAERDLLSVHLERQHTIPSFADVISKKFKRYDRNVGLDCAIVDCRLRKTRPHLHCRQCQQQISPFDLEIHVCEAPDQGTKSAAVIPIKKITPTSTFSTTMEYQSRDQRQQTELTREGKSTINSPQGRSRDYEHSPSVTFLPAPELRHKASEIEKDIPTSNPRSQEDEKVIVVRAAGTYFPENTTELSGISSQSLQKSAHTEYTHLSPLVIGPYCSMPYCKMKRKSHEHCEYCDQSFVDPVKMKTHRLKHVEPCAPKEDTEQLMPLHSSTESTEDANRNSYPRSSFTNEARLTHTTPVFDDQPQDLSLPLNTMSNEASKLDNKQRFDGSQSSLVPRPPSEVENFSNLFHPDLMCSISMQNFHLARLASLYQQNPYYNQHLNTFSNNAAVLANNQLHQHNYRDSKSYFQDSKDSSPKLDAPPLFTSAIHHPVSGQFPFLNPLLMAQTSEPVTKQTVVPPLVTLPPTNTGKNPKRKLPNNSEDFNAFIDALSPSAKRQMQLAAGLAAAATTTNTLLKANLSGCSSSAREQSGQHFKIRYEQIPTGYLKFRFNEDCYFPKCGYRNHQSHFHCDRNDCHYSFCDKTRFVQHTARHERLDKLMGNDFRQYRAKMNCGYENCPYFKNLGSANKSSHFHCLKCEFICSDTNKVVAHRRQHSKMEYIRMAGFRKVTNSEKCTSNLEANASLNGNETATTVECSYSQKQTHYHCLVCDVSVLSRAQLASHKHKA